MPEIADLTKRASIRHKQTSVRRDRDYLNARHSQKADILMNAPKYLKIHTV